MSQIEIYKILTYDKYKNIEFTDIMKDKYICFDKEISIDFISFESLNKMNYVLIVTRNYTKNIIIKTNDDGIISILYNKNGDKNE